MNNTVNINLDPINDGIVGDITSIKSTVGAFFIVGTNFEHKAISPEAYMEYLEKFGKNSAHMIIDDYMIIYDKRKVFQEAGYNYFVGSFLFVKCSNCMPGAMERMDEDDIEEAKMDISCYFTEMSINGITVDALQVD